MAGVVLLGPVGVPGSGKSTFLERFAQDHHIFYLRSDELRRRLFDPPKHTRPESDLIAATALYVIERSLIAHTSIIWDVNLNRRAHRDQLDQLAKTHGATFHLLWFQVPLELAHERVKERAHSAPPEWKKYHESDRPDLVEYMSAKLEQPEAGEQAIVINGAAPYEQQLEVVSQALSLD